LAHARCDRSVETLLFLPGAGGDPGLWRPLADALSHPGRRRFVRWPGFGGIPADPGVGELSDLVDRVASEVSAPTALFAQSMGGVVALRLARRFPDRVGSLVLSVTSGGLDVRSLGAVDWRPSFIEQHPGTPRWFIDGEDDLTGWLPEVRIPTLLLWGDADPISPVAVGERLAELLPEADLIVIPGGTHDLVFERATEILPHVERHLNGTAR
jgi:pimeloyl-ACP methyl ester carboxylesterase